MGIGRAVIGLGLAASAAAALAAGPARAADYVVTVGAWGQLTTPYEGAGRLKLAPAPTLDIRPVGAPERATAPDDGLSLAVLGSRWFSVGPVVEFIGKRDDHGDRQGLKPVGAAVEPGIYLNLWPTPWLRLRAEALRGVSGHHGWIEDAGADLAGRRGRWAASIGPRVGFGDADYMRTYFEVTPAEAAASPLIDTVYQPGGGLRYLGLEAALSYRIARAWQAAASFGYHRLADGGADSPIVGVLGSRNEFSAAVGVKYSFNLHL